MSLDPVPWFVGGGAEHSADVARLLAYAATGGGSGVIGSGDFKISALPTPGGAVRASEGAAAIVSTTVAQQSYIARAPSPTDISIAPTGAGTPRSDMVVLRINDHNLTGGTPPADPKVGPYVGLDVISNVGGTATTVPGTYALPAIPLARIDLPASTSAVTAAMITDLRTMPSSRSLRKQWAEFPAGDPGPQMVKGSYAAWPSAGKAVQVPSWATKLIVTAHVSGVKITGTNQGAGLKFEFAGVKAPEFGIIYGENNRATSAVVGEFAVAPAQRGTSQSLVLTANHSTGTGGIWADYQTSLIVDYEFLEVPA